MVCMIPTIFKSAAITVYYPTSFTLPFLFASHKNW